MRLIEERASTAALLVINLMLVAVAAVELRAPLPEKAAPAAATRSAEARLDLPAARPLLAQLSDYQEITERPLFWSERRGFAGSAVADVAQTTVPFVLLGVVTGAKSKALLAKPDGKEVTRASKGDVVEGWLIEEVGPQGVTLASGNVRRELQVGPGVSKGN
ncbi:MAG TPA: hypothetical protein VGE50_08605 [Gammaproteobacteria bacterium]